MDDPAHIVGVADGDRKLLVATSLNWRRASEVAKDKLRSGEIDGIRFTRLEGKELTAFTSLDGVRRVKISRYKKFDLEPLYEWSGIEELELGVPGDVAVPIKLSRFPALRSLSIQWHKRTSGLDGLSRLQSLKAWKLPAEYESVSALGVPNTVEYLEIVSSALSSTSGIGDLVNLKQLDLSYLRALTELVELGACSKLSSVTLEALPRLASYQDLANCPRLKELRILNCAPTPTLQFLRPLSELETLTIFDTKVSDLNFSIINDLKSIRAFGATRNRSYFPPIAELETLVTARARGAVT